MGAEAWSIWSNGLDSVHNVLLWLMEEFQTFGIDDLGAVPQLRFAAALRFPSMVVPCCSLTLESVCLGFQPLDPTASRMARRQCGGC